MKKLRLALVASLAVAISIIGINAPTQASVPQATLITCTDLNTQSQIALKPGESICATFQALAVWHSVQTDTGIPKGANITTLKVCTSKNPSYTYQVIANWCPKYQVSTTYYRALNPPPAPAIMSTIATSYNSVQLLIAGNSASDSPVAYYLVKNLATGITQKVAPTNSKILSISGLSPSTTYSFSITAVNVDGTSSQSSASQSIATPGYVSPQNSGPSQSTDATLSAMVVTTATLSPNFSSNVTSYSATVSNATTSITESATVTESHATLTINGTAVTSGTASAPIALSVGANTITTVVTAQNGSTKTYTVTITRTGANDATISAFSFSGLSPVVTGTVNNTAHTVALYVPSGTSRTALVATFSIGVGATMTIGGVAQTSGVTANNFTSPLTYTVTAQDGVTTQNYVVTVADANCAHGGTCVVGDTGPGGGTVYYVSVSGFTCGATQTSTCHYLEVAPNTWNGGVSDPIVPILATRPQLNGVVDGLAIPGVTPEPTANLTASALGLGYQNTSAIANYSNNSATAAGLVRSYNGGAQNDWYIGDMAELNLLCQWVTGHNADPNTQCSNGSLTSGGFRSGPYWSSSQSMTTSGGVTIYLAYIYYFPAASIATDQFADSVSCPVRPIRSF